MTVEDLDRRFRSWLTQIDPTLADPPADPGPAAFEPVSLWSDDGALRAHASATLTSVEVTDLAATWGALDRLRLRVTVLPGNQDRSLESVVTTCARRAAELSYPGGEEAEMVLLWPAVDRAAAGPLAAAGFTRVRTLATCEVAVPLRGSSPMDGTVRPLRGADVERATDLWLEQVRFDARYGSVHERPTTRRHLRSELRDSVAEVADTTQDAWVCERDGSLAGLALVSWPESAAWIAPLLAAPGHAYFSCLSVTAEHRGKGVGSALVARVHAEARRRGVHRVALHYGDRNPVSPRFWAKCGYHSRWHTWRRAV